MTDELAKAPNDTAWTETLRTLGYDELRTWIVARFAAATKEQKILSALSEQLDAAYNMRTSANGPQLLQAAMAQAKHMRDEALKLRNERLQTSADSRVLELEAAMAVCALELSTIEELVIRMAERQKRAAEVLGRVKS